MGRYRPWLAAILAVLVAGLGHAYLRRWRRAALWFVAILGVGVALSTTVADPSTVGPTNLPLTVAGPLLALYGASAIDAFRIARDARPRAVAGVVGGGAPTAEDDDAAVCPHCGRSVDPDLDFCTWCTKPLDEESTDEESTGETV
ncbi:MAG: DUF6677 family protein [Haloferacaceae archaeon]